MRSDKKSTTRRVLFGNHPLEFAIVSVVTLAMALLVFFLPENTSYKHYDASGTIESVTPHTPVHGGSWYEFTLKNDNNVYCLDSIAKSNVNGSPNNALKVGSYVELKIAKTDSAGRLDVSYIKRDGKVYLTTADYEKAHKSNYTLKHVLAYIFFGLFGVCVIITIVLVILDKKLTVN